MRWLRVDLPDRQPVADVVADGHVREQRVILEDGVDVALERRLVGHVLAVEQDAAAGRQLEAGDHAQRRGLARPGRPEHREELAVEHVEIDAVDGDDVAEALLDAERDRRRFDGRWRVSAGRAGRHGIFVAWILPAFLQPHEIGADYTRCINTIGRLWRDSRNGMQPNQVAYSPRAAARPSCSISDQRRLRA